MTVFITGDRSASPILAGFVAVEMIRAFAAGEQVETGDNPGIEALVRAIADTADVPVNVVATPVTDEGYSDWDARHASLDVETRIAFIHGDPLASRIGASLQALEGSDDRVSFVSPQVELLS